MTPLGVVAIIGAVASIVAYSQRPRSPRRAAVQFVVSLLSWSLLWYGTASPFAAQGMMSLPKHMIAHILVMFLVPIGLIASGTLRSYWWILRPAPRRRLLTWWYRERRFHAPKWLFNILSATIVLNGVMVASHLPRVFDFVMSRPWMMQWLVEPAFLVSGLFFFHFIVPSAPRRLRGKARYQLAALFVTLFEMLMLAMSMSIFTKASWYSVMIYHPGMASMSGMKGTMGMATTAASAFSQQREAAGFLWICGDAWAIPCLIMVLYRVVKREGSLLGALERHTSRLSGVAG
ncbi:MAG TPA: cytochrome c oxidase assembly protein [Acidimicrobiales bacterium]